jgi:hypothetical protein
MRFRRATCGLCKPTKRYKRRNHKREAILKRDLLEGVATPSLKLREHHH